MPFSWADPSISGWPLLLALALIAWHHEAVRSVAPPIGRRERWCFIVGALLLALSLSWPLAALAQERSLTATVLQRQVIILGAAPLLLLGTPSEVVARLTRPRAIDWIAARASRPVIAIAAATILLGVTMLPFAISAASSNGLVRAVVLFLTIATGFILWLPVIDRVPGVSHLTRTGKAVYLFAQSIAPTFLSFAWIFATHPIYGSLHGQHAAIGMSPLVDQQAAAYLSKLGTFGVLWTVAYIEFMRSGGEEEDEESPLHWADVERELQRADRRNRR